MTLIYVMIRNLWLIMAIHRIFLNCNNSYICPYVKCVKIGCLFQTENVTMLLQNNCINNGVTSGLKEKKEKKSMQNSFIR